MPFAENESSIMSTRRSVGFSGTVAFDDGHGYIKPF